LLEINNKLSISIKNNNSKKTFNILDKVNKDLNNNFNF